MVELGHPGGAVNGQGEPPLSDHLRLCVLCDFPSHSVCPFTPELRERIPASQAPRLQDFLDYPGDGGKFRHFLILKVVTFLSRERKVTQKKARL